MRVLPKCDFSILRFAPFGSWQTEFQIFDIGVDFMGLISGVLVDITLCLIWDHDSHSNNLYQLQTQVGNLTMVSYDDDCFYYFQK